MLNIAKLGGVVVAWLAIAHFAIAPHVRTPNEGVLWSLPVLAALLLWVFGPALWVFGLALWRGKSQSREVVTTPGAPPAIDPKKWTFNAETGEYHEIKFRHKEGFLYDKRVYQERFTERLQAIWQRQIFRNMTIVMAVIWAVCFWDYLGVKAGAVGSWDTLAILGVLFGGFVLFVAAWGWIASSIDLLKNHKLPPAPVARQNRDGSGAENVHGEGGFATREDIDRAARGVTHGTANQQEFED